MLSTVRESREDTLTQALELFADKNPKATTAEWWRWDETELSVDNPRARLFGQMRRACLHPPSPFLQKNRIKKLFFKKKQMKIRSESEMKNENKKKPEAPERHQRRRRKRKATPKRKGRSSASQEAKGGKQHRTTRNTQRRKKAAQESNRVQSHVFRYYLVILMELSCTSQNNVGKLQHHRQEWGESRKTATPNRSKGDHHITWPDFTLPCLSFM